MISITAANHHMGCIWRVCDELRGLLFQVTLIHIIKAVMHPNHKTWNAGELPILRYSSSRPPGICSIPEKRFRKMFDCNRKIQKKIHHIYLKSPLHCIPNHVIENFLYDLIYSLYHKMKWNYFCNIRYLHWGLFKNYVTPKTPNFGYLPTICNTM